MTGLTAPYYVGLPRLLAPVGLGSITMTNPEFQVYQRRRLHGHEAVQQPLADADRADAADQSAATSRTGRRRSSIPTGQEFRDGASTIPRYNLKMNGSYTLPWEINASANFNLIQGASRTSPSTGPARYTAASRAGTAARSARHTRARAARPTRFKPVKLLDLGLQKACKFGGKYQIKLMFDAFNVFNINTITAYSSGNEPGGVHAADTIIAPRVFRFGTSIAF